ncbi:MAG: hypothetical protein Q8927_07095 [Bacteroidota bacterium]|nr:hypothetical protein [Bacteroidota bacterium]MDP4215951.1 hypothetical protein [Bacteroidota bacterium]MDP4253802.1 hypothetical protein [Bacteroidota bacterium]
MKNARNVLGMLAFCIGCLPGCVPLKEVNLFAEDSRESLGKMTSAPYGYASYCYDSTYINKTRFNALADLDGDCRDALLFDSLLRTEYETLAAYFAALGQLSGAKTRFDFSPVAGAIQPGTYGGFTITSVESKAVNALAATATALLTTGYKHKKIKGLLTRFHDTLDLAITFVGLHANNLKNKVLNMQIRLKERTDLMVGDAQDDREKWALAYIYKQKSKELAEVIDSYDARCLALQKIRQGHQKLVDNVEDLGSATLKKEMLGLARDIIYISNKAN